MIVPKLAALNQMAAPALQTQGLSKEEKYQLLLEQASALTAGESDITANLANLAALIYQIFCFHWSGFYLVKEQSGKEELVLGPFQGPVACTRIGFGKGVCGTAWKEKKILRVDDVNLFPGHIACSPFSKSEIVIPVFKNGQVVMVLDIDSDKPAAFDETDEKYLRQLADLISTLLQ